MYGTLEFKNEHLCVVLTHTSWLEPMMYVTYYPIQKMTEAVAKEYMLGDRLKQSSIDRNVYVSIQHGNSFRIDNRPNPNGTYGVAFEEIPMKKPRGKHKWVDGEWRKVKN